MIAAVIALEWLLPSVGPVYGLTTYYADGLIQEVAANRHMDLAGYLNGVALNRRGDLGRAVWLEHDGQFYGPMLAVDCSALEDYPERLRQGYVAEIPYRLAQEWSMAGPVPVTVHFRRVPDN